jgi:hypothetical protein
MVYPDKAVANQIMAKLAKRHPQHGWDVVQTPTGFQVKQSFKTPQVVKDVVSAVESMIAEKLGDLSDPFGNPWLDPAGSMTDMSVVSMVGSVMSDEAMKAQYSKGPQSWANASQSSNGKSTMKHVSMDKAFKLSDVGPNDVWTGMGSLTSVKPGAPMGVVTLKFVKSTPEWLEVKDGEKTLWLKKASICGYTLFAATAEITVMMPVPYAKARGLLWKLVKAAA